MIQMQKTLVILKPDALQRGLVGRILARFEDKGLQVVAGRFMLLGAATARELYSVHEGKEFYEPLVRFITAGPILALVLKGEDAISVARGLMGATASSQAQAGTIRGDYALSARLNLVHGSDSEASARREIPILFQPEEIIETPQCTRRWIYGIEAADPDAGDPT
jgi:nucleoside-diphosphate kinase